MDITTELLLIVSQYSILMCYGWIKNAHVYWVIQLFGNKTWYNAIFFCLLPRKNGFVNKIKTLRNVGKKTHFWLWFVQLQESFFETMVNILKSSGRSSVFDPYSFSWQVGVQIFCGDWLCLLLGFSQGWSGSCQLHCVLGEGLSGSVFQSSRVPPVVSSAPVTPPPVGSCERLWVLAFHTDDGTIFFAPSNYLDGHFLQFWSSFRQLQCCSYFSLRDAKINTLWSAIEMWSI